MRFERSRRSLLGEKLLDEKERIFCFGRGKRIYEVFLVRVSIWKYSIFEKGIGDGCEFGLYRVRKSIL